MIKNLAKNKIRGYTLVEALIYIAIFVLISLVTVTLILSVLDTNRRASPLNALSRGAVSALEVISREIRMAKSIDTINSVWATSTGSLQLNSLDAEDNSRTVRFYLDTGLVKVDENGTYLGPLSSSEVLVTGLTFNLATSTGQNFVKITLNLTAGEGANQKNDTFYSAVSLRTDN